MNRLILLTLVIMLYVLPVHAQQVVTVFSEDFDRVGAVDELAGWVAGPAWRIDTATPSTGSGLQSLGVYGAPGDPAVTPAIDLRRITEGVLSYLVRKTGSFYENSIVITASIDGGNTFPVLVADSTEALQGVATSWRLMEFQLPASLLGQEDVRFRFENFVGGTASASARFDDIAVTGLAKFDVEPPQGIFAAEPGNSDAQSFVLTNYGAEPLTVHAPELNADEFAIDPAVSLTLQPQEAQTYEITFAPVAEGVVYAELNITTDGAGGVTIPLTGLTAINQVSFSFDTTEAGESEADIAVPVSLTFSNEEANLHALELALHWDDQLIELTDVQPGPHVAGNGWSLSYESGGESARILLFDDQGAGLAPEHYDPIMTFYFRAGLLNNGPREVQIVLDEVIGALAVPTADDAGLFIKDGTHSLRVEKRHAYVVLDVDELDLGMIEAGETASTTFTISNPAGDRPLGISGMTFTGGPYTVSPESALIEPDSSLTFTVTFAPTDLDFGLAAVSLDIEHDAELDGLVTLPVRGIGTYGRGDNDGDGMVDAMDIVNIVDFILDRAQPSTRQLSVSDLYPFSDGDGSLDVRDLSVSVQAIVSGVWPDDVSLPVTFDPGELDMPASKRAQSGSDVVVAAVDEGESLLLALQTEVPLRALQVHLRVEHLSGNPVLRLNTEGSPTASGRIDAGADSDVVRLLLYRPDGGVMAPGRYTFASLPRSASGYVDREYATAITAINERQPVDIVGLVGTGVDETVLPQRFDVGAPYPNPFGTAAASELAIPIEIPDRRPVRLEVYDLLGRRLFSRDAELSGRTTLTWSGRDSVGHAVAPGLYLVRISSDGLQFVRQVVVMR